MTEQHLTAQAEDNPLPSLVSKQTQTTHVLNLSKDAPLPQHAENVISDTVT